MTKRHENKLTMYEGVTSFFTNHQELVNSLAALQRSIDAFGAKIEEIKDKSIARNTATAGKTQAKRSAEKELIDSIMAIASGMFAWAIETGNNEVSALTDVRRSYLTQTRDTELAQKAEAIYRAASDNIADLGDYGITTEMVTELSSQIAAYNAALGEREGSMALRSGAVVSLKTLFQEADDILKKRIDRLMETFVNSEPEFYSGYRSVRVIRDL
jgi:hypothetical protein